MGAHNIDFELDGNASFESVKAEFKARQKDDADTNGHQQGYSGDFQTVRSVQNHGDKIFDSKEKAYDHCLNNAKKWEYLVAVKYKVTEKSPPSNATVKAGAKLRQCQTDLDTAKSDAASTVAALIAISDFIKCGKCKSRLRSLNMRKVTNGQCPVCLDHMYSKATTSKIDKLHKRLVDARQKYDAQVKKDKEKAAKKSNKVNWLVAGWAAS